MLYATYKTVMPIHLDKRQVYTWEWVKEGRMRVSDSRDECLPASPSVQVLQVQLYVGAFEVCDRLPFVVWHVGVARDHQTHHLEQFVDSLQHQGAALRHGWFKGTIYKHGFLEMRLSGEIQ